MRRQISQALTNLLQNAVDAIAGAARRTPRRPASSPCGCAMPASRCCSASRTTAAACPRKERDRLTEPYVTTRTKGTGLGLAIVKKIMEDHGGELILEDRDGGGARVVLLFHRSEQRAEPAPAAAEARAAASKSAVHGA